MRNRCCALVRAGLGYSGPMATYDDPRILRAIAHPTRNRILGELFAAGPLRAADIARKLAIPANQASFHLRQLAKYGLVEEEPDEARDTPRSGVAPQRPGRDQLPHARRAGPAGRPGGVRGVPAQRRGLGAPPGRPGAGARAGGRAPQERVGVGAAAHRRGVRRAAGGDVRRRRALAPPDPGGPGPRGRPVDVLGLPADPALPGPETETETDSDEEST